MNELLKKVEQHDTFKFCKKLIDKEGFKISGIFYYAKFEYQKVYIIFSDNKEYYLITFDLNSKAGIREDINLIKECKTLSVKYLKDLYIIGFTKVLKSDEFIDKLINEKSKNIEYLKQKIEENGYKGVSSQKELEEVKAIWYSLSNTDRLYIYKTTKRSELYNFGETHYNKYCSLNFILYPWIYQNQEYKLKYNITIDYKQNHYKDNQLKEKYKLNLILKPTYVSDNKKELGLSQKIANNNAVKISNDFIWDFQEIFEKLHGKINTSFFLKGLTIENYQVGYNTRNLLFSFDVKKKEDIEYIVNTLKEYIV